MQEYLESNPEYVKQYNYAMGPPNGGYYKRWIQGSVGMMSPLALYGNEYGFLYMKYGQNNLLPYRGNIKYFSPSVTNNLRKQVKDCSLATINPVGCQNAAINKVYTKDSTPGRSMHYRHSPDISPHPFNASYETGMIVGMPYIPPNTPNQD